mmetsp:Transcript_121800/g.289582  ORF Transcript_121800/g.289582 Transcript_121800/m.289582 type:complete len:416 (-) Transcript_121800:1242-2489(-)
MENGPSNWLQAGVNVPRACVVLATLQARSELTRGNQEVDVVGTDEVLRHANNRSLQGCLSVVVGTVLAYISNKLRNLHVRPQVALEATVEDLALSRLQTIHDRWHTSHQVVAGELYQLFVHKLLVGHSSLGVIHKASLLVLVHPDFAIISTPLVEGHVNQLVVTCSLPLEVNSMLLNLAEVLFGFSGCACTKTFVVLDFPPCAILGLLLPLLVLNHREKLLHLPVFGCFDNWCDELLQKTFVVSEQVRPKVVEEVDQKSLNVRPIIVLIGHNHHLAVAQILRSLLVKGQAQDLHNVHGLFILGQRLLIDFPHVQQLPSKRKDPVFVSTEDCQTGHRQRLGAVTFCENQGALLGQLPSCFVCIFQLWNTQHSLAMIGLRDVFVHHQSELGLCLCNDCVHNASVVEHLVYKGARQAA